MRVQQVNNEQHFYARNQTNLFRINSSLTTQMFNKKVLQAVDTLQGKSRRWFSKFVKHNRPSINGRIINMAWGERDWGE